MTHKFDGYNYLIRLQKGELLMESLRAFAREQNIKGAWISGLGGAQWAELGIYNLAQQQYEFQHIDGPLELTALQGNIAWQNDKPLMHLHVTASNRQLLAIGGHAKEVCIGATCELFLHTIFGDKPLTRAADDEIGLPLLGL